MIITSSINSAISSIRSYAAPQNHGTEPPEVEEASILTGLVILFALVLAGCSWIASALTQAGGEITDGGGSDVDADGDEEVDTDEPRDAEADADEVSDADPEDLGYCTTAPESFTLSEPLDGTTVGLSVDLVWNNSFDNDFAMEDAGLVQDTVTYTVIVATSREYLEALLRDPATLQRIRDGEEPPEGFAYYETNISGTRLPLSDLAADTPHYWVVLAHDLCDDTDHIVSSPINSFITIGGCDINIAPATFDLIGPAETDTELRPLFEWNPANDPGDTVRYRIEVSANPRFLEPDSGVAPDIVYERNSDGSYITANNFRSDSPLAVNTPYYWRVVAIDACGAERVSSNGLSFTTIESCEFNEPTDFFLSGPGDIELGTERLGLSPEFTWEESVDGDVGDSITYHFYLVRVDGYGTAAETEVPVWDDTTTETRYSLEGRYRLRNDAVYRWYVTSEDACGNPAESIGSFYFQTIRACSTPPYDFTLIGPAGLGDGGEGHPVDDITLRWNAADEDDPGDTVYYDVYLIDTAAGRTVFHDRTTDTFVNLGLSLRYGTRYRWYVRASDDCGNTTESEALTFDTIRGCDLSDPLPFSLSSPPDGEPDVSIRPRLEWDPSATGTDPDDAITGYEVEIATDEEFSDAVSYDAGLDTFYALTEAEALARGRTYFWRVYAIDECGNRTASSEVFSFTTRTTAICAEVGDEVRVTDGASSSAAPSLVWTGSEYGVSFHDNRERNYEVYFQRMSAVGARIGDTVRISDVDDIHSGDSLLVWSGTEYGVSWMNHRAGSWESSFAHFSNLGVRIGDVLPITSPDGPDGSDSQIGTLVWTGSEYAMAWHETRDGNYEIYFQRVSGLGARLGDSIRVTEDEGSSIGPTLVWTGSEYGLAWRDNRDGNYEIYLQLLSGVGARIGDAIRITEAEGDSLAPALVWTTSEYGLTWHDNRDGNQEIYFQRLSRVGDRLGDAVRITEAAGESRNSSLVWTGTEYAIAWQDIRDSNYEIYFQRLSRVGDRLGDAVRITEASGDSYEPSLVWTGTEYAMAWQDLRSGNWEAYFTRMSCVD